MIPITSRIAPIVWMSIPLTVAFTPQIRIAPAAASSRLAEIPMCSCSSLGRFRKCAAPGYPSPGARKRSGAGEALRQPDDRAALVGRLDLDVVHDRADDREAHPGLA